MQEQRPAPQPGADVDNPATGAPARRPLPAAAERALAEAAVRRAARDAKTAEASKEIAGRGGLDPTRYGDWEINGLTSDF